MEKSLIKRDDPKSLKKIFEQISETLVKQTPNSIMTADTIILCDVSGSMMDLVDDKPKIDHLLNVLKELQPRHKKFSFSDQFYEGVLDKPHGSTDMANAFRNLQHFGPRAIILVSDGRPNSEEDAIVEAIKLGVPIYIVYIGIRGDKGEFFMRKLAKITGGKYSTVEAQIKRRGTDFYNRLGNAVSGYLTEGTIK